MRVCGVGLSNGLAAKPAPLASLISFLAFYSAPCLFEKPIVVFLFWIDPSSCIVNKGEKFVHQKLYWMHLEGFQTISITFGARVVGAL
jgi:hypothetical protein